MKKIAPLPLFQDQYVALYRALNVAFINSIEPTQQLATEWL